MNTATLISDFHGLPAGTKLIVVSQYVDCQNSDILVVERVDGQKLPCLGGPSSRTSIAANLVTIDAVSSPARVQTMGELMREEEDRLLAEASTPERIKADDALWLRNQERLAAELASLTAQGMIERSSDDDEEDADEDADSDDELTAQLATKGFTSFSDGRCAGFIRQREGASDVITSNDGLSAPDECDWLLCTYAGDWLGEAFGDQPLDSFSSRFYSQHLVNVVDCIIRRDAR